MRAGLLARGFRMPKFSNRPVDYDGFFGFRVH
ncbi:hypothetical protein B11Q_00239 [Corynebacterium diphtheriae]|nr:hypothetical protein B11Q_00239 [Corynebacterium diphtheriae]